METKGIEPWKSWLFIGSLGILVIVINRTFDGPRSIPPEYQIPIRSIPVTRPISESPAPPEQPRRVEAISRPRYDSTDTMQPPIQTRRDEVVIDQSIFGYTKPQPQEPQRNALPQNESSPTIEPPTVTRKSVATPAEDRAAFLNQNLSGGFTRQSGKVAIAVATATEDSKLNSAVTSALVRRLQTGNVELVSSFFKPAFISGGAFSDIFNGSGDAVKSLELSQSLDGVLLAREEIDYENNPALENTISAHLRMEVSFFEFAGGGKESWSFSANGVGFSQKAARQLAEERLIKQIGKDTSISLGASLHR